MKKIIEVKCIICYEPFLRKARPNEKGKNVRNRTKYKKVVRPLTTDTCGKKCAQDYRTIYSRLMGRRKYREDIREQSE